MDVDLEIGMAGSESELYRVDQMVAFTSSMTISFYKFNDLV